MRVLVVNRSVIDRCPVQSLLPSHYWSEGSPAEPGQPAVMHCVHELKPGDQVLHRGEWCRVTNVMPGRVDDITGDPADLTIVTCFGAAEDQIGYEDMEDAR